MVDSHYCWPKNGKDCSTVPDDESKKTVVDEIRDGAGDDAIAVVVVEEEVAEEATFWTHPYQAALIMVDGTCPNARVPGVDSF